MKYAAINTLRHAYPVRFICAVLQVSASGYYAWRKRRADYSDKVARLKVDVLAAHSNGLPAFR